MNSDEKNVHPGKFYRISEVAEVFDVHVDTIYRWIKAGILFASKQKGRNMRIPGDEILRKFGRRVDEVDSFERLKAEARRKSYRKR